MQKIYEETDKFAMNISLCWHCSRATDASCSWSEDFIPVDGWTAKKSTIKGHYGKDTYLVEDCPLFARYEYMGEISDKGAMGLINAVLTAAGKDYLRLLRKEKKMQDRDAGLSTKRKIYKGRNESIRRYQHNLYGFEHLDGEIPALERWFVSEQAELFGQTVNPVWLMQSIQKEIGCREGRP